MKNIIDIQQKFNSKTVLSLLCCMILNLVLYYCTPLLANTATSSVQLNTSCNYAKEHLKFISSRTEQYIENKLKKEDFNNIVQAITVKWEEVQFNNICFKVGEQNSDCQTNSTSIKELKLTDSILNLTRSLSRDLETNKSTQVITNRLKQNKNLIESEIKENC